MTKSKNHFVQAQNVPPTGMHNYPIGPYLDQVEYGQKLQSLGIDLNRVWQEQQQYNKAIISEHETDDPNEWTQTYLMGIVSEVNEVLDELRWKRHRKGTGRIIESNLARELADVTKYVLSLWQIWGFTPQDMIAYVAEKNEVLAAQWKQEQDERMPHDRTILFDVDGTVADYRQGLTDYLSERTGATDSRKVFYQMDMATGMDYDDYHKHKNDFEELGGYRELPPIKDAVRVLKLHRDEVNLVAVTARPKYLSRSWADTWFWLKKYIRPVDQLWLAGGERLSIAKRLRNQGYDVITWEDAPVEALRYAEHGFSVWMRDADYNREVSHRNITRVNAFPLELSTYFGG